jgi:secondary thiamine-phosphate synthase enzyme
MPRTAELEVDTRGRRVTDITERVASFAALGGTEEGSGGQARGGADSGDGLLHVFLPHATAGLALMETGSGSEGDLEQALDRLLPRDDRYTHRHGSVGHGADHLLPAFVSPSITLAVEGGRLVLGTWQSLVIVDLNRENNVRRVRLSLFQG